MEGGPNNGAGSMISFGENGREAFSGALMNPCATSSRNALLPCLPLGNSSHQMTDTQNISAVMLNELNSLKAGSRFMESNNSSDHPDSSNSYSMRAKIMAHPYFPRLLAAYVNCQKVGAPPEVVARLEHVCSYEAPPVGGSGTARLGDDPSLDQFMEAYCEMLIKYEEELTKPIKEAVLFLARIESQFKALSTVAASNSVCGDLTGRNMCSEEEVDVMENWIDPHAEDHELKGQLLRRYSGYLGSLKRDFLKKKKKGKLPKEARQQLLEWWSRHYKWPYPSESQKLALAESTGLDQKQINNWFINQRKRHWKPTEDMQFVVMDATCSPYYMENVMGNHFPMDCTFPHH